VLQYRSSPSALTTARLTPAFSNSGKFAIFIERERKKEKMRRSEREKERERERKREKEREKEIAHSKKIELIL